MVKPRLEVNFENFENITFLHIFNIFKNTVIFLNPGSKQAERIWECYESLILPLKDVLSVEDEGSVRRGLLLVSLLPAATNELAALLARSAAAVALCFDACVGGDRNSIRPVKFCFSSFLKFIFGDWLNLSKSSKVSQHQKY